MGRISFLGNNEAYKICDQFVIEHLNSKMEAGEEIHNDFKNDDSGSENSDTSSWDMLSHNSSIDDTKNAKEDFDDSDFDHPENVFTGMDEYPLQNILEPTIDNNETIEKPNSDEVDNGSVSKDFQYGTKEGTVHDDKRSYDSRSDNS